MILLDTGFLFALKMEDDENHEKAIQIFQKLNWKQYGTILTNNLIVNETMTLVNMKTKNDNATYQIFYNLFWGEERFFKIYEIQFQDYSDIAAIMHKYSDQISDRLLSFVDASLLLCARKYNIQTLISFDHHFDGHITRISQIE
jgi:predicted nucleic acid-binding protein